MNYGYLFPISQPELPKPNPDEQNEEPKTSSAKESIQPMRQQGPINNVKSSPRTHKPQKQPPPSTTFKWIPKAITQAQRWSEKIWVPKTNQTKQQQEERPKSQRKCQTNNQRMCEPQKASLLCKNQMDTQGRTV